MVSVWEVTHHSLDCSVGLSFCAMWYKALIAFMLNKGGFLSAGRDGKQSLFHFRCKNPSDGFSRLPNSIQVIPKDQTSTFPSYWPSSIARMTSGAILDEEGGVWNEEEKTFNSCQNCFFPHFPVPRKPKITCSLTLKPEHSRVKNHSKAYKKILSKHALKFDQKPFHFTDQYGVPTKELAGEAMEAEPKSASLTCPGSVSRTLPAFTSLQRENESEGQTVLMKCLMKLKHWKNQWLACGSYCGSEGRPVPVEHHVWWRRSLLPVEVSYELRERSSWKFSVFCERTQRKITNSIHVGVDRLWCNVYSVKLECTNNKLMCSRQVF